LDRVAHDVQHRAALDAGADAVVLEMYRDQNLDALARDQALEIHVFRRVTDGVELHAADQRADRPTAGVDLIEAGLPAGPVQFAQHDARVQCQQAGFLPPTIDDSGHLARTPSRPRRPLTG